MFLVLSISSLVELSETSQASIAPLTVYGFVVDFDGNPVVGADVTITVLRENGESRATRYCTSDSEGGYVIDYDFAPEEWDVGNTLRADAAFGGDYGSNTTVLSEAQELSGILSVNVTYPVKPSEFAMHLFQGWNLMSLPFIDSGYNASTLGLVMGDVVAGWNSSVQAYDRNYIVGLSPRANDFAIEPTTGYWVYAGSSKDLIFEGDIPTARQNVSITVPYGGGWVLIGLASVKTTWHASDLPIMYHNGTMSVVAGYDSSAMTYKTYYTGLPMTDYLLIPGHAYWCWVSHSGWLTYDP